MSISEEQQGNPDVNTYNIDSADPGETENSSDAANDAADSTPLPPDSTPPHPVEEPPDSEKPPVGDVDDSPKQIA